jgi:hypothetical protein
VAEENDVASASCLQIDFRFGHSSKSEILTGPIEDIEEGAMKALPSIPMMIVDHILPCCCAGVLLWIVINVI